MRYYIKNLLWRIHNTWSWAKLVWQFRWYEYGQVYAVMRFSLVKALENFDRSKVKYVGMESDMYYMRLCVKLIDRLQSEYYEERAHKELDNRWGNYKTITETINDGSPVVYKMVVKRELDKTEADSKRYREDFVKTYNFWMNKHEKAKKLLFRILNEKLEKWWI